MKLHLNLYSAAHTIGHSLMIRVSQLELCIIRHGFNQWIWFSSRPEDDVLPHVLSSTRALQGIYLPCNLPFYDELTMYSKGLMTPYMSLLLNPFLELLELYSKKTFDDKDLWFACIDALSKSFALDEGGKDSDNKYD